MTNIVNIENVMNATDKAFVELTKTTKRIYYNALNHDQLPHKDVDDINFLYLEYFCAAVALAMIQLKTENRKGYQLLCNEYGGEFELAMGAMFNGPGGQSNEEQN